MEAVYVGSMEATNGKYADLTQEVPTLIKQRLTDTEQMEAEASKAEVEEAEASKLVAEASKEEDSKEEAHRKTSIINNITITIRTNIAMVLPQQLTQISRAMQHPATQPDLLHRVDLGMEIITIIIEPRPGMLTMKISAMFPIGPPDSCIH